MSPQYRHIPPELSQIFEQHARWLRTGGKQGKPAILPNYDFQTLNLSNLDLERADFEGSNFAKANLSGTDLKQANLRETKFSEADVSETNFHDANLEKADLTNSIRLDLSSLARANLDDCQLPEDQEHFSRLDNVEDASGITSSLFTAMLIACGYVGITAFTTSDIALLTNTGTTSLPFLGVGINMAAFYIAAPFLLLATYIYFHLNFAHLWETLVTLPAIFPDGQRLDQKVYPWLFNWLPSICFVQTKRLRHICFASLQRIMAIFLAWYFVPLILIILWFRYLYVRNFWITLWHLALLTAAAAFGFRFREIARAQLEGKNSSKPGRSMLVVAKISLIFLLFYGISDGFFYGVPAKLEPDLAPQVGWYLDRRLVPQLLNLKPWHLPIAVNFAEAEVSRKIGQSYSQKKNQIADEEILAEGALLSKRNLRCAYAKDAFMAKADLRYSILELAYLAKADLRGARLGEPGYNEKAASLPKAFLAQANLSRACLYKANLYRASLESAVLKEANLEHAVLAEANLRYADLRKSKMRGAILREANLQGADLQETEGLAVPQVREARAWILAYYDPEISKDLGLYPDHNDRIKKEKKFPKQNKQNQEDLNLQTTDLINFDCTGTFLKKANLWKADLRDADLSRANLQEANLSEANLYQAKFDGTDLSKANLSKANLWRAFFQGATGLTADQLKRGKNWRLALYDADMILSLNLSPDHNYRVLTNQLEKYDLSGADLKGAFLVGANFKNANLRHADLSWTELREANLQGANLSGADLTGAYLGKANLQEANLEGAILDRTNLDGADLTGVKGFKK